MGTSWIGFETSGEWPPAPQACAAIWSWYFTTEFETPGSEVGYLREGIETGEKAASGSGRRRPSLEANRGSERNPQVVVGTVLEVDLVARVESQSEGSREALQRQSRVDGCRGVARGDVAQRTLKA